MAKQHAHVCQTSLAIHNLVVNQNVSSIQIVQAKKHVSTVDVRILVKLQHAVSIRNVESTITQPIVIVKMVLWAMRLFIAYQFYRLEIRQQIHAFHRHVHREVFAKCTEMLLFVIHVQMKMVTIIQDVGQNVYRTVIVNLVELV